MPTYFTVPLRGPRKFYSYENMSEASISIEHTFQNIPGSANTYKDETSDVTSLVLSQNKSFHVNIEAGTIRTI